MTSTKSSSAPHAPILGYDSVIQRRPSLLSRARAAYSRRFFPAVLDYAMSRRPIEEQRAHVVPLARGKVLEIGFGTGRNLPFYTPAVERLFIIEPHAGVLRRARRQIARASVPVTPLRFEDLPDQSMDAVVSTWTLCTIADVNAALRMVHRVLKPGGQFLFIEHGLAPDALVARWQNQLNGVINWLGDGCNLDRDIDAILSESPLSITRCDHFYLRNTPRVGGYTYRGTAMRA